MIFSILCLFVPLTSVAAISFISPKQKGELWMALKEISVRSDQVFALLTEMSTCSLLRDLLLLRLRTGFLPSTRTEFHLLLALLTIMVRQG